MKRFLVLSVLVLATASCAHPGPVLSPALTSIHTRSITFYGRPLAVHFALPTRLLPLRPMLLFATGDGGFRGKDKELFEELASFGYPVAGFSARNYLRNLGYVAGTTTPQKLAWDYQRLIAFSERELALPANMPVVLVGNSRGAGLSVVAAGQRLVRREISGVLAIALTGEEEYVRHYRLRRGQLPPGTPRRELVTLQTYEYLPRLSSLPVAVIQSTRDGYLPADEARRRFGPDTGTRQLHAIKSWSHSFMGARDQMYAQARQSLQWICSFLVPAWPAGGAEPRS